MDNKDRIWPAVSLSHLIAFPNWSHGTFIPGSRNGTYSEEQSAANTSLGDGGGEGKASLYTLYSIILNAPSESNKKSSNILDVH